MGKVILPDEHTAMLNEKAQHLEIAILRSFEDGNKAIVKRRFFVKER